MHELSIAHEIVEIVQQYVPGSALGGVKSVRLRVGGLSGVVPDSLAFSFAAIVSGTPLESARLDIERVPALGRCEACGREFEAPDLIFVCSACGGTDVELLSGSDLRVIDIELDESDMGTS